MATSKKPKGGKQKDGEIKSRMIYEIPLGRKGSYRLSTVRFGNMDPDAAPMIDLRKCYMDDDNNYLPTGKGVAMDLANAKKMMRHLRKLVKKLEDKYGLDEI